MTSSMVVHRLHRIAWELYHFWDLREAFPLHFHDCLLLGCLLRGRRKLFIAGAERIIEAGDVILLPPYTPHGCQPVSQEACEWICLHGALAAERWTSAQVWQNSKLAELLAALASSPTGNNLKEILHNMNLEPHENSSAEVKITAYAAAHPEPICPKDTAKCEKIRFLRRFREAWGITPGRYRESVRVNHAKRLIKAGESLVTAAEGFCDQSHLNRVFKKHLGVTPGVWRTSWGATR